MKVHEAETILKYYADIPQRIEIIRRQCTALSDEVDPMRGMGTDGMPRVERLGTARRRWPAGWMNWALETNCVSWNGSGLCCWKIRTLSENK